MIHKPNKEIFTSLKYLRIYSFEEYILFYSMRIYFIHTLYYTREKLYAIGVFLDVVLCPPPAFYLTFQSFLFYQTFFLCLPRLRTIFHLTCLTWSSSGHSTSSIVLYHIQTQYSK